MKKAKWKLWRSEHQTSGGGAKVPGAVTQNAGGCGIGLIDGTDT
jgi:hypothetical protein